MAELDGIQDAFVDGEIVLHIEPGGKPDWDAVTKVLEKHKSKVKVTGDPKESPEHAWKTPKAAS